MSRVSDREIEAAANDILDMLKCFDRPADAASALTVAHFRMLGAVYIPTDRAGAFEAVDDHAKIIKELINEEWQ